MRSAEFVRVLSGNALWPGMVPYAANYGGHQFGQWGREAYAAKRPEWARSKPGCSALPCSS